MLSEMVDKSSESPLNPVKTLSTVSDTLGLSERVRNPVKILESASDTLGLSERVRNPVKSLSAASEETGLSDSVRNPVKILSTTSDRAGISGRNLPADLAMLSEIADVKSMERPLNPWKSLTVLSERTTEKSSGIFLRPVKSLASASDIVGVSAGDRDPPKPLAKASEGALLISVRLPDRDIPERRAGHWSMSLYEGPVG